MIYNDFIESGYRVFGLNRITGDICGCGRLDCPAAGKHPVASNWQHTPEWSEEQLETMELMGHFDTGYGVLCFMLLVIDVDERNGGADSYAKLVELIPSLVAAGLIVKTGSGGQSKHLYFRVPETVALMQHLKDYPGIDFKSSGFVVGPGSLHKSGNRYEVLYGSPDEISDAPPELIELLKKPDAHRTTFNGHSVDVTDSDIEEMLKHIPNNDEEYDYFITIGMCVHNATGGTGYQYWEDWASKSDKFNPTEMPRKWHSFGKCSTPVTVGTLMYIAAQNGWQSSYDEVTFLTDQHFDDDTIDTAGVDLKRPPGFVGHVAEWINSQCLYPREMLSVAAALVAVGNICGLRYKDNHDGMSTNLIAFCVAGSSTGKEAVQQAYMQIMRAAELAPALHGDFKSQQEVIRNLLRHQMCTYMIDELGITLRKIINSQKSGGASYLEGLLGIIMSAYSKADGFMPISGDVREEVKKILIAEMNQCKKKVEEHEDKSGAFARRYKQIEHAMENIDNGLERPFLSVVGFTTPVTFNAVADYEQATNGFLSRALIFNELETNPRRKNNFKKQEMPERLALQIHSLVAPGEYSTTKGDRIEYYGQKKTILTSAPAARMLDQVYQYFWDMAEQHKGQTGLEAIPRRGYELCAKISTILAAPTGVREDEHVRYAFKLSVADVEGKLKLAYANVQAESKNDLDAVSGRIVSCISSDHGETLGVIVNRCRPHKKELVEKSIARLLENGIIKKVADKHAGNKKKVDRYFLSS